jgi:hypothetical protein
MTRIEPTNRPSNSLFPIGSPAVGTCWRRRSLAINVIRAGKSLPGRSNPPAAETIYSRNCRSGSPLPLGPAN